MTTKIFGIYAILFHELFKIKVPKGKVYMPAEIMLLEEKNLNVSEARGYITNFKRILCN